MLPKPVRSGTASKTSPDRVVTNGAIMNLTMVDGWLDSQIGQTNPVYVSTSGDDNGKGSMAQPFKTAKRALGVAGVTGVFFKGGDVFHEFVTLPKGGVDGSNPLVLGSYGSGRASVSNVYVQNKNWIVIRDLILTGKANDLIWLYGCSGIWVEGCLIGGGNVGITAQCYEKQTTDHTYRRNVIRGCNPKASNPKMRSQGMFIHNIKGVKITENLVDHAGWTDSSDASPENHGLYCYANCDDVTLEANTFLDCSATGAQCRAGGIVRRNLFLNNPIGLTYGLVNGAGEQHSGGCVGEVKWNVVIGNRNISPTQPRGNGISIGANIRKAVMAENLMLDDVTGVDDAFVLEVGRGSFAGSQVGYLDLLIQGNRVYAWSKGARAVTGNYPRNIRLADNYGFEPFENANLVTIQSVGTGLPNPKRLPQYVAAMLPGTTGKFEDLLRKLDGWKDALSGGAVCDWIMSSAGIKTNGAVPAIPVQQFKIDLSVWPGGDALTDGKTLAWPNGGNIKASFDTLPKKVQFWLDGTLVGTQSFSPFFAFGDSGNNPLPGPDIAPGSHVLKVQGDTDPTPLIVNFTILGPVSPTPIEMVQKIQESVMGGQNADAIDQCNKLIQMLTPTIPT
jgi:hypothetical protein